MAENKDNKSNKQSPKQRKLMDLQLRRLVRQERENKELKKQITILLNYQKEMNKKAELTNKSLENSELINKEIRKNNKEINSILSENKKYIKAMKEAQEEQDEETIQFYKDALKDNDIEIKRLKQLNKDIKKGDKKIKEELEDVNENLETLDDTFKTKLESLRETLDSFNIMEIKDSVENNTDEIAQSRKEILDGQNLSREERAEVVKRLTATQKDLNKMYNNAFSAEDMDEAMNAILENGLSIKDMDKLIDEVVMLQKIGVEIGDYNGIMTFSSEEQLRYLGDTIAYLQELKNQGKINNYDQDAILSAWDTLAPAVQKLDPQEQLQMQKTFFEDIATLQSMGITGAEDDLAKIYLDRLNFNPANWNTYQQEYGQMAYALQGNYEDILGAYLKGLDVSKRTSDSYMEMFPGISSDAVTSARSTNFSMQDAINKRVGLLENEVGNSMSTMVEEAKEPGWLDKFQNWLSPYTSNLVTTANEFGIEWDDVKTIRNLMFALVGNDLLSSIGSKIGGKLFGKGATTVATEGASTVAKTGVLSSIGSVITSGLGSVATALGGAGALAGGGALLGGLGSLLGLGSSAKDLYQGFKNNDSDKKWSGSTKLGMVGAGAATGAALGSIVPGVGTVIGGLIGGGIGGVGALFGGETIADWIKKNSDGAIDALTNIGSTFLELFGGMFGKTIGKLVESIGNLGQKAYNKITGKSSTKEVKKSKSEFSIFNPKSWFSHRNGLDKVPYDGYKAILHNNEMVLTADEAEVYRRNRDMMNMYDANATQSKSLLAKLKSSDVLGKAKSSLGDIIARMRSMSSTSSIMGNTSTGNMGTANIGDDFIGAYTVKYETGSSGLDGGGMVSSGANDPLGGVSYGIPQYSTKQGSAKAFANWLVSNYSQYAPFLGGKTPGTSAFSKGWKDAFAKYGKEFSKLQLKYNYSIGYDKWVQGSLRDFGINFNKNRAFQEVAYSMATQHGPAGYKKYLRGLNSNMSDVDFLNKLYSNRINRAAVPTTKRWKQELQEMLSLVGKPALAYEQGTPYVPNDQIALLHKGEMVVPKNSNPLANGETFKGTDLTELIKLLKWGFEFLGKKFEEEKVISSPNSSPNLRSLKDIYNNVKIGR